MAKTKSRTIRKTTVEEWEVPDGVMIDELVQNAPEFEEEDDDLDDDDLDDPDLAEDEDDDVE